MRDAGQVHLTRLANAINQSPVEPTIDPIIPTERLDFVQRRPSTRGPQTGMTNRAPRSLRIHIDVFPLNIRLQPNGLAFVTHHEPAIWFGCGRVIPGTNADTAESAATNGTFGDRMPGPVSARVLNRFRVFDRALWITHDEFTAGRRL